MGKDRKFFKDTVWLRDDRILLYTTHTQKKPLWQVRMRVKGIKGYVRQSAKTSNLGEASAFAEELYDEMRFKIKNDLPVKKMTFATVYAKWLKTNEGGWSIHRKKFFETVANRYFIPYFGNKGIETITDRKVEDYWAWRISYWQDVATQRERDRFYHVERPSKKTLQMEKGFLRQIFLWARKRKFVLFVPDIQPPKTPQNKGIERRPAFNKTEYQKLYRHLRKWANQATPDNKLKHQRKMLYRYVLFMANTGLRPNEAKQLLWKDIKEIKDKNNDLQLQIHISPSTKTGEREVIPTEMTQNHVEDIKSFSPHTNPDDYVFCSYDGKPVDNFGRTFKKLLAETNLLTDRHGRIRTIYSLRHTYATMRLLEGEIDIYLLSKNLGTSVKMIEQHYSHVKVLQKAHVLASRVKK